MDMEIKVLQIARRDIARKGNLSTRVGNRKFKIYLYGIKEFELISDHKPLETIFWKKF